jgi:hypothetical protein
MNTSEQLCLSRAAIHAIAEIKNAAEAFDRGDANIFDALDAVTVAIDRYRAAAGREPCRDAA